MDALETFVLIDTALSIAERKGFSLDSIFKLIKDKRALGERFTTADLDSEDAERDSKINKLEEDINKLRNA